MARYSKTGQPFPIQPGPRDAHSLHPMAFNPMNGLLYIPAMLNTAELSADDSLPPSRYALSTRACVRRPAYAAPDSSRLIA